MNLFRHFLGLGRVLLAATAATTVSAQEYSIDWFAMSGGGGTSTNGGYSLSGTIGQPDAGATLTGGGYTWNGGFWIVPAALDKTLYVSSYFNNHIHKFILDVTHSNFGSIGTPHGLAFDRAGNLYATSFGNNTILKFTADGIATVFANTGLNGPNGLAFDSAGNLYTANHFNNTIRKFTPEGDGSVFASTNLSVPQGLAFDSAGNLYVANFGNRTIKKITPGGVVSHFASTVHDPQGVAFDGAGNLYVANRNRAIQKFTPEGVGSLFANTTGSGPHGLAFDNEGNLYVANSDSSSIEKFTPDGVGSAVITNAAALNYPTYIAFAPEPPAPLILRITAVERLGDDLCLSFTSMPGRQYVLQSRSDPASSSWTNSPGTNIGTGGILKATLTNAFVAPQQFYRVQALP